MTYRAWVWQHISSATVRSTRMRAFDDFTDRWPRLRDWFQAPLRQRLFDRDVASDSQPGLAGATVGTRVRVFYLRAQGAGALRSAHGEQAVAVVATREVNVLGAGGRWRGLRGRLGWCAGIPWRSRSSPAPLAPQITAGK